MPKIKLTKTEIEKLKYTDKGQVIYWDTDTPGLGLVVGMTVKTFRLQIDVKAADNPGKYKTVKKTLGRYGTELTLEQAKKMVSGYVDEKGQAVVGERLVLKTAVNVEPEAKAPAGTDMTLHELVSTYYRLTKRRDGKERKAGTSTQYTKLVERHYAGWLDMLLPDVAGIVQDTVLEKYRTNELEFGKATARNSASVLSSILNYGKAAYPGALTVNPMAILSNPHICVRQAKQARHDSLVYDPDKKRNDFSVFLSRLQRFSEIGRDGYLFTLYTGMRRAEVENLQWADLDLEHKELLVKDTKNRHDLHIPLNSQAMEILKRRQRTADGGFVFPQARAGGKNRTGHIQLNALMLKTYTGLNISTHGLRRSYITIGRKLKRFEDTDRLTNHVDSSMSGRHYDETDLNDLRKTAQMIGNEIERLMMAEKTKVIQLPTAQAV